MDNKTRRKVQGIGAIAGVALALAGTAYGTSSGPPGGVPAVARVALAPQSYPASSPCPITGNGKPGADPDLDRQKNRYTAPSATDVNPSITTPADMIKLSQPNELTPKELRKNWPNDLAVRQLTDLEGHAVTVVGYLVGAKEENTDGGESCNCNDPSVLFDYHLYLADQPGVYINKAVVVEMTPRWRAVNPTWGTADNNYAGFKTIKGLVNQEVRVTGWLLFDEEHLDEVGQYRATVWEIHPITTFEYQKNGGWVVL